MADGLSLLIPVFNQAGTLERAVVSWTSALEKLRRPFEIIIINDGSTDTTKSLFEPKPGRKDLFERIPGLKLLEHTERRGFGACLRTALPTTAYPLVLYTGLDHAYHPDDLKPLLHRLDEADPETGQKIDLVNGYRSGVPMTGWRKHAGQAVRAVQRIALGMHTLPRPGWLGSRAHRYAALMRALFGLRVGDVDSKFKLFRRRIFDRIPIQSDGEFVHAEILAKANFLGCLMDEMPIGKRPGPFTAQPQPPEPSSRWSEMRRVFLHPDFGPASLPVRTAADQTTQSASEIR